MEMLGDHRNDASGVGADAELLCKYALPPSALTQFNNKYPLIILAHILISQSHLTRVESREE